MAKNVNGVKNQSDKAYEQHGANDFVAAGESKMPPVVLDAGGRRRVYRGHHSHSFACADIVLHARSMCNR